MAPEGTWVSKIPSDGNRVTKPPAEPGLPVTTWRRRTLEKASNNSDDTCNNNTRVNNSTTSTSPVVLVAGPGPDGKPVTKPPEGTWIIINPRLAGLFWKQFGKDNKTRRSREHSNQQFNHQYIASGPGRRPWTGRKTGDQTSRGHLDYI